MYDLNIKGATSERDLKCLEEMAQNVPEYGAVLEIGSFHGRSGWMFSKTIPETATITCIDTWLDYSVFEEFSENTKDCKNLIPIRGDSTTELSKLIEEDKKYDLIFIDGDHTNPVVCSDIQLSYHLVKNTGILSGHDFNEIFYPDVISNVVALAGRVKKPVHFHYGTTIWKIVMN